MLFDTSCAKLIHNPTSRLIETEVIVDKDQFKESLFLILSLGIKFDREYGLEKIIQDFKAVYYADKNLPASSLKGSIQKICEKYSKVYQDLEIVALSLIDGTSHFVAISGCVFLCRGETYSEIIPARKNKLSFASGPIKPGDLLILGTESFSKAKDAFLKREFLQRTPQQIADNLSSYLTGKEDVGALLIRVEENGQKVSQLGESKGVTPKRALDKLFSFFDQKKLYAGKKENLSNDKTRVAVSVGVILLTTLVVSIFFGIRQKKIREYELTYRPKLEEIEHKLKEGEEILAINPQRARGLFLEGKVKLQKLVSEGIEDQRLAELQKRVKEKQAKVLGEYEEASILFLDLSLLSSGFKGNFISSSNEEVFVLDSQGEKVVGISISSKRSEVIAGPEQIDDPLALASYSDRVFIVNSKGVFEVGENFDKMIDPNWKDRVLAFAYAGNFYTLDKDSSKIFRYQGIESGFSSGSEWLSENQEVDLVDSVSWAIDGSIWVLEKNGKIDKFSLGNKESFTVSGAYPELLQVNAIYTNDELKYIYVLDNAGGRVVVLDKNGAYKAQYISSDIKGAINLIVSEKEGKIILLTGEKLLALDLRHL
ncbi:hypothetical protein A2892_04125 [Candidatus Woesebacteria bacterium RIFCSPLOWO2_01_FULL_39_10b]|uniref:PPM-type phosphatase domain-containing protein n=1 Tax=Candidatus Woesebacteria bacterium RIFCSPLOWO2_01_FULL_39_10b TaxID=1802517 RepID=A0A1F8B957_9BACT|nr:MAG: hypothetical protein A2892_04125 [Candidatus Woesebacteria bacterium RIFCSPLOWO2_01_FULL_39_10b]